MACHRRLTTALCVLGLISFGFFTFLAVPVEAGSHDAPDDGKIRTVDPRPGHGAPEYEGGPYEGGGATASEPEIDAPLPRTENYPLDVPADEILPAESIPHTGSRDRTALATGQSDGDVLVLVLEDFQLQGLRSSDGGATFSSETVVPTTGGADVLFGRAEIRGDTVYVVNAIADAGGDIGLDFVRSTDFGGTWDTPVVLLEKGDDTHGLDRDILGFAANSVGDVAVVYREGVGDDPYALVSTDSGATWKPRVKLNSLVADGGGQFAPVAAEVDDAGVVHAAFVEDRGSGDQVWHTRSTDGGLTFAPEQNFDVLLPERTGSTNPVLEAPSSTSQDLLFAFYDNAGDDHVYVLESDDFGANFVLSLDRVFADENAALTPVLRDAVTDILLGIIDGSGNLTVQIQDQANLTWSAAQTLVTGTATGLPSLAETDSGSYGAAWADNRSDTYIGRFTDLFARISTDGGATWGTESRVDVGTTAGTVSTDLNRNGLTGVGADDLLVVYTDLRNDARNGFDVFANRTAAGAPSWTNEQRIDTDAGTVDVNVFNGTAVAVEPSATDAGATRVYAAMQAVATGREPELRVAVSDDGGYTIARVNRVGANAGAEFTGAPRIVTTSGGRAYVVWGVFTQASGWELRYSKTDDAGVTWAAETNFGVLATNAEYDIVALDGGTDADTVILVWPDGTDIKLAKSTDGGDVFGTPVTVNTNTSGFNRNPLLCYPGSGNDLFVSFAAPDIQFTYFTVFVTDSFDLGDTFDPETQLLPDGPDGGSFEHAVDCFVGDCGPVTPDTSCWVGHLTDTRDVSTSGERSVGHFYGASSGITAKDFFNTFGASADRAFAADVECTGPNSSPPQATCLFYVDESDTTNGLSNVIRQTERSEDGVTAAADVVLTEDTVLDAGSGSPVPGARSQSARVASDGSGNIWVNWLDRAAGQFEMVARHSTDGGATWGDLRRLSRETPQGTKNNSIFGFVRKGFSAAVDGEAFFVWAGERKSPFSSGLLNAWDTDDLDRDQSATGVDCDDEDPGVKLVPPEVGAVQMAKITGAVRMSWTSLAPVAGSATVYDLVTGQLSDLTGSGDYSAATCLQDDNADTFFDITADPPAGDGDYFLVRGQNSCGDGTYGDSTETPDPRDDLDASGTCP